MKDSNPDIYVLSYKDRIIEEYRNERKKRIEEAKQELRQCLLGSAWINTYTGKKLYPLAPRIENICIRDIAHALSMICRFTGHTQYFSSVAYHSVLVSLFCDPCDALKGLMHDGSEFALTDLSSPIKRSGEFENYKKYEKTLQSMIYTKFCGSDTEPESVKKADLAVLYTEARDLLPHIHPDWHFKVEPLQIKIEPLSPAQAEQLFLDRFKELILLKPNGQELYETFMAE